MVRQPMIASVCLVDADPDLAAGIPGADLELARRVLTRPLYEIPAGRWAPELLRAHDNGSFGILVVGGAIVRQLDVADRHCTQILGPGDVLHEPPADGLLSCPVTWAALQRSAVVVLDARFTLAAQRWPMLSLNLHRRLLVQADRVALHAAISQLPRVDRRLVALFLQLAERWGRVTPAGIELQLRLTHEALGRLVGAQRPTVTLALGELADEGVLRRGEGGNWVLDPNSREMLRPSGHAAPALRPAAQAAFS
jgi:CRP-like cAMP-binding protein